MNMPVSIEPSFAPRLRAMGQRISRAIGEVFPQAPSSERVAATTSALPFDGEVWSSEELAAIREAVTAPAWELVRRGGKCWRPYLAMLACEAVGGDGEAMWPHVPVALELMQIGSLVIDDIEDGSTVRRNGPAAHLVHGVPKSINSGTLCYLLWREAIDELDLSVDAKFELQSCVFETLAAAHVGQGLDLHTVGDGLEAAVDTGEVSSLRRRIRTIHHLKTARFIGALGRIGGIIGGARCEQVHALQAFGEALGQAYQIRDDVLNLVGYAGDLRPKAEDLLHGKITFPMAVALGRVRASRRRWLGEMLQRGCSDEIEVAEVVAEVHACGAIAECSALVDELFESSWSDLVRVVPHGRARADLRAFGEAMLRFD